MPPSRPSLFRGDSGPGGPAVMTCAAGTQKDAFRCPATGRSKAPKDCTTNFPQLAPSGGRDGRDDADRLPPLRGHGIDAARRIRHACKAQQGDGRSAAGRCTACPKQQAKKEGVMLCQHNPLKFMVGRARFERATLCLKGRYSTA